MTRTITPFRITLILDGDNAVAQLEQMERVIDDDGTTVLSARALPAETLPFPMSKKFLDKVTTDALEVVEKLNAKLAKKDAEKAAAVAEKEAEKATLAAELAEKAESLAAIDEIEAAIANPELDNDATIAAVIEKVERAKKPARDKELDELKRQRDEIAAKIAELQAEKKPREPKP